MFLAVLPVAAEPSRSLEGEKLQAAVDRIQRQCLRAYSEELLADMASGAREIPDQVESDPKAQMQFLDKEVPLEKGLFYPILLEDVLPAFERYVSPGDRFLDLGSGDGRVLFLANVLGAHAVGIEYDETMVKISRQAGRTLEDLIAPERLEIVRGDFFESSWSDYDVVFYFDLGSFAQERVRRKLRRELGSETVLLIAFEQAPFPGFELVTAFPEPGRPHPEVTVYRRRAAPPPAPAAPPSPEG